MSKRLNEEQEAYTEMYRELQEIAKMKDENVNELGLFDGKKLVNQYKDELSIAGIKTFFSD